MKYNTEEKRFFARLITLTKYEARERRKLDFALDLGYLVDMWNEQNGQCALAGIPMSLQHGSKSSRTNPWVCTMDRIDPTKGYVPGNVQLVTWRINRMKHNLSQQEFLDITKAIVNKENKCK